MYEIYTLRDEFNKFEGCTFDTPDEARRWMLAQGNASVTYFVRPIAN